MPDIKAGAIRFTAAIGYDCFFIIDIRQGVVREGPFWFTFQQKLFYIIFMQSSQIAWDSVAGFNFEVNAKDFFQFLLQQTHTCVGWNAMRPDTTPQVTCKRFNELPGCQKSHGGLNETGAARARDALVMGVVIFFCSNYKHPSKDQSDVR